MAVTDFWRRPDDLALTLLAFAAGSTDVLSFLALGGTFTSAMTGNTAVLGMTAGQGRLVVAERALTALIGFALGVVAGTLCRGAAPGRGALVRILGFEALCLASFTALWAWHPAPESGWVLFGLILLSAGGMGAQSVAARHINLPGLPTVVFTTTLTTMVMAVVEAVQHRQPLSGDVLRQAVVFSAYLIATLCAGALAAHSLGALVLLPLCAVLVALTAELTSRRS